MAINVSAFGKKLNVIVSRRSEVIITRHKARVRKNLSNIVRAWKKEIQKTLDIPYRGSTGAFPRRRTGDLMRSLHFRITEANPRSKTKRQAVFNVHPIWEPVKNSNGKDYGEMLNSSSRWSSYAFFGWKDRTNEILKDRISKGIL